MRWESTVEVGVQVTANVQECDKKKLISNSSTYSTKKKLALYWVSVGIKIGTLCFLWSPTLVEPFAVPSGTAISIDAKPSRRHLRDGVVDGSVERFCLIPSTTG